MISQEGQPGPTPDELGIDPKELGNAFDLGQVAAMMDIVQSNGGSRGGDAERTTDATTVASPVEVEAPVAEGQSETPQNPFAPEPFPKKDKNTPKAGGESAKKQDSDRKPEEQGKKRPGNKQRSDRSRQGGKDGGGRKHHERSSSGERQGRKRQRPEVDLSDIGDDQRLLMRAALPLGVIVGKSTTPQEAVKRIAEGAIGADPDKVEQTAKTLGIEDWDGPDDLTAKLITKLRAVVTPQADSEPNETHHVAEPKRNERNSTSATKEEAVEWNDLPQVERWKRKLDALGVDLSQQPRLSKARLRKLLYDTEAADLGRTRQIYEENGWSTNHLDNKHTAKEANDTPAETDRQPATSESDSGTEEPQRQKAQVAVDPEATASHQAARREAAIASAVTVDVDPQKQAATPNTDSSAEPEADSQPKEPVTHDTADSAAASTPEQSVNSPEKKPVLPEKDWKSKLQYEEIHPGWQGGAGPGPNQAKILNNALVNFNAKVNHFEQSLNNQRNVVATASALGVQETISDVVDRLEASNDPTTALAEKVFTYAENNNLSAEEVMNLGAIVIELEKMHAAHPDADETAIRMLIGKFTSEHFRNEVWGIRNWSELGEAEDHGHEVVAEYKEHIQAIYGLRTDSQLESDKEIDSELKDVLHEHADIFGEMVEPRSDPEIEADRKKELEKTKRSIASITAKLLQAYEKETDPEFKPMIRGQVEWAHGSVERWIDLMETEDLNSQDALHISQYVLTTLQAVRGNLRFFDKSAAEAGIDAQMARVVLRESHSTDWDGGYRGADLEGDKARVVAYRNHLYKVFGIDKTAEIEPTAPADDAPENDNPDEPENPNETPRRKRFKNLIGARFKKIREKGSDAYNRIVAKTWLAATEFKDMVPEEPSGRVRQAAKNLGVIAAATYIAYQFDKSTGSHGSQFMANIMPEGFDLSGLNPFSGGEVEAAFNPEPLEPLEPLEPPSPVLDADSNPVVPASTGSEPAGAPVETGKAGIVDMPEGAGGSPSDGETRVLDATLEAGDDTGNTGTAEDSSSDQKIPASTAPEIAPDDIVYEHTVEDGQSATEMIRDYAQDNHQIELTPEQLDNMWTEIRAQHPDEEIRQWFPESTVVGGEDGIRFNGQPGAQAGITKAGLTPVDQWLAKHGLLSG